jgi:hypothetical protein
MQETHESAFMYGEIVHDQHLQTVVSRSSLLQEFLSTI